MERMISIDKFKGVVDDKTRVMIFIFKIYNVGETSNRFQQRKL